MMHDGTDLTRCAEDKRINKVGFTLTRLDSIEAIPKSKTIDVMGIVLEVGPCTTLNLRGGDQKKRRILTICDESRVSIVVTLWGDDLCNCNDYARGQVIAFRSCRVSDFNGKTLNASSHPADLQFADNLNHPRAKQLKNWQEREALDRIETSLRPLSGQRQAELRSDLQTMLVAGLIEHCYVNRNVAEGLPFFCKVNCMVQ